MPFWLVKPRTSSAEWKPPVIAIVLVFFAFLALIVHLIENDTKALIACGMLLVASPALMLIAYPPAN